MSIHHEGSIAYYQFESLQLPGLMHGLFARHGGVSPAPWQSLNVGGTVGDAPQRVAENRRLTLAALGLQEESLFEVWQTHSADYVVASGPRDNQPLQKADILLTASEGVTLYMRFADCVPILLYDPKHRAAAIAHAGWLGTLRGAAGRAVRAMGTAFGTDPEDIVAGIGPSIGPDHYYVGDEVQARFVDRFGQSSQHYFHRTQKGLILNLWRANRVQLEGAGVSRIEEAGICTVCHNEDWYSHRAEDGQTGRFGALIALTGP